ncbi:hypothetical protein NDN08_002275 [Rhodosorus marinus]|uniref:ER membrane protein complex subunit 1 n=1 Tax=Rhodosorus marinus TaxID=101924 RepID=A0AAV8UT87_9RHOD|nr:hypothetical protein NDN08_002275 [Rhodosorus marinus]
MAVFKRLVWSFLLLVVWIEGCFAKIDVVGRSVESSEWSTLGIGAPSSVFFSPSRTGPLYLGTDIGVVAALSRDKGRILWRYLPPEFSESVSKIILNEHDRYLAAESIQKSGMISIRVFSSSDGTLLWQREVCKLSGKAKVHVEIVGDEQLGILCCDNEISLRSLRDGSIIAEMTSCEASDLVQGIGSWKDESGDTVASVIGFNELSKKTFIADLQSTQMSTEQGMLTFTRRKEFEDISSCDRDGFVQINRYMFACSAENALYLFDLRAQSSHTVHDSQPYKIDSSYPISSDTMQYRDAFGEVRVVNLESFETFALSDVSIAHNELCASGDIIATSKIQSEGKELTISMYRASESSTFIDAPDEKVAGSVRRCYLSSFTSEIVSVTSGGDVVMSSFDKNKQSIKWIREEAIAYVTDAMFGSSLPNEEGDDGDWTSTSFAQHWYDWIRSKLFEHVSTEEHRAVVLLSSKGKMFGLSTKDGKKLWSREIASSEVSWNSRLFKLDDSRVAAVSSATWTSIAEFLNTTSGEEYAKPFSERFAFVNSIPLNSSLVILGSNGENIAAPDSKKEENLRDVYWVNSNRDGKSIQGYRAGEVISGGWQVAPPPGERFALLKSIPEEGEFIASATRPTGNRRVLHKYINRMAVAAITSPEEGDQGVTVYLIDAVRGKVLDTAHHVNGTGPVSLVRCENWIVYSFWDVARKSDQIYVIDYFEPRQDWFPKEIGPAVLKAVTGGEIEKELPTTPHAIPNPVAARIGFEVDGRITGLDVTTTERAITMRSIVVHLDKSRIVVLPKEVLDPRRPVGVPTEEHRAEMLMPYNPFISLLVGSVYASKDLLIPGLRNSFTAPVRGRESSSHVLASGIDIFHTVLAPAGKFDALTDEFMYTTVQIALVIMIMSTLVLRILSSKLMRSRAWLQG